MPSKRLQEMKVGLFAITAIILSVVIIASLSDTKRFFSQEEEREIWVDIPSAAGLEPYNHVAFAGKEIGYLETIDIWEEKEAIKLVLRINDFRTLKSDSVVQVKSKSALGGSYLEVSAGTKAGTPLRELPADTPVILKGEPYVSLLDLSPDFAAILDRVEELISTLKTTIEMGDIHQAVVQAGRTLKSAETLFATAEVDVERITVDIRQTAAEVSALIRDVTPLIAELNAASAHVVPLLSDARENINQITERATGLIEHTDELVQESGPAVQETVESVRSLAKKLETDVSRIADEAQKLMTDASGVVDDNRDELSAILANLVVSTQSLSSALDKLDREPWRLIWKTPPSAEPQSQMAEWDQSIYLPCSQRGPGER